MSVTKEELLKRLSDGVVDMEEDDVIKASNEYLEAGYAAYDGIMEGLVDGMNRASQLYDDEEYFVTDVLLCSDAMYEGLSILRPHLSSDGMNTVIELLKEAGIRENVKVMIGGGPISKKFADKIGADGYSDNAVDAVRLAKKLLDIA
ncbi:B12-binding domain-containing protein [Marinisporobacter balticus]|uniref:B12 binding protein n=1 Tax=Marinisporobacter balticus TaxID=2018667 RepID=A0A4R2LAR0_9FIRM|nr:B12-binding domain-containing protein [Marinisporobacter balticus]TCO79858.1 B12 binding protein [Marinisporobacter balticus]